VIFALTALEPLIGGKSIARGQLRFHGVERTVSFPISIETNKQTIVMDGDVTIDTRDYGLPVIKKYFILMVDPILNLHFHLQGKLADS
jgi:polyisoprenoid-binding protein YceI